MAPQIKIPDEIQCLTIATFNSQLSNVQTTLSLPETEDNWEKISLGIQTFVAIARGGASKYDPEFVNAVKANYRPIVTSMASERTRLSTTALEFVSTVAPLLAVRFEPLVPLFVPAVLKLLTRPNKVFITRAQAALSKIIENCHLPTIVPYLRDAVKDKSQSLRLGATEATLLVIEQFDRSLLDVREAATAITTRLRGNVEDIEAIIKDTARDANPNVRQTSRKVFEKYREIWPERVDTFIAPLTPTIRKYLNVKPNTTKPAPIKPLAALKLKAAIQQPAEPSPSMPTFTLPAGPSRPVRPTPQTAPVPYPEVYPPPPPSPPESRLNHHVEAPEVPTAGPSNVVHRPIHAKPNSAPILARNRPFVQSVPADTQAVLGATELAKPEERVVARPAERSRGAKEPALPSSSSGTTIAPPSRPPSRVQHVAAPPEHRDMALSSSVPPEPVHVERAPPARPTRVVSGPAAPEAAQIGSAKPASSGGPFRVQRARMDLGPPGGPMGHQTVTARAVSVRDPPSRPLKRKDPPPRDNKEEKAENPADETAQSKAAEAEVKPEETKASAPRTEDSQKDSVRAALAKANALASSSSSSNSTSRATGPPAKILKIDPMVSRPNSAASNAPSSSAPTTRKPAVLQRRAAPPPGQTQGFAPTRRRPGLTEPTLSQLAKQKPTKTFVATSKKAEAAQAPTKKSASAPVATAKKTAAAKGSEPSAGSTVTARSMTPVEVPKEVEAAVQVPLPPMTPDETPLTITEDVERPITPTTPEPVIPEEVVDPDPPRMEEVHSEVSQTVETPEKHMQPDDEEDLSLETTPRAAPPPRPINSIPRFSFLPDPEDTTVIMAGSTVTPPSFRNHPRFSFLPDFDDPSILFPTARGMSSHAPAADLMDFDISVVLSPEQFAPMTAVPVAPIFTVHRDSQDDPDLLATPRNPPPVIMANKPKAKELFTSDSEGEGRFALSERELNILASNPSTP
ncbi:hypothetical protein FRB99_005817 [Tulasnella sp. 403]|nr:hypothetical protein FRB99_005817 [Tulasnella sp. 403]